LKGIGHPGEVEMKKFINMGVLSVVLLLVIVTVCSPIAIASSSSLNEVEGLEGKEADKPSESLLGGGDIEPQAPPDVDFCTATPPSEAVGNLVNITCMISDDVGVVSAWVEVKNKYGQVVGNFTMAFDTVSMMWCNESRYYTEGLHTYTIRAKDVEGNVITRTDAGFVFTMTDSIPPVISGQTAIPSPQDIGQDVNISCDIADNGAMEIVTVEVWDPDGFSVGNFTMSYDSFNDKWFYEQPYMKVGAYDYVIYAKDTAGFIDTISGFFVMEDKTPPTISDVQENPNPQEITKFVNISAIISDLDGVAEVLLEVTDPDAIIVGNWTMNFDVVNGRYYYNRTYIKEGIHDYIIWARDPSGNWNSYSGTFDMRPDWTPPVITGAVATPSPQEIFFYVNITADITDNSAMATVQVVVRDPSGTPIGNFSMGFDSVLSLYYHDQTYDILGTWTFTIWAGDTYDIWSSASGSFVIEDTTVPVISQVAADPNPQQVYFPVNISCEVSDNLMPSDAWVVVTDPQGMPVGNFTMIYDSGNGKWYYRQSYNIIGTFTFTIWANDTVNNFGFNTGSFTMWDTIPPAITGHSALPSPQESNSSVNISCKVTDNYQFFGTWVEVMDPFSGYIGNFTMLWDPVNSEFYLDQPYWQIGTHDYRIWLNDTSNNWDFAVGSFVIQDTTNPIISDITKIPQPQEVHGVVNVSAIVTDNYNVKQVIIDILDPFGGIVGNFPMSYDSVNGRYYHTQTYDEVGTYSCNLWTNDPLNNQDTATCNFDVVDTTPPVVSDVTEVPDPGEVNQPVNVSAVVSDNYVLKDVWLDIRDPFAVPIGNYSMAYDSVNGRFYYERPYGSLGIFTFTVWAFDYFDNWGKGIGSFRLVDTTSPVISAMTEIPDPQEVYLPVNVSAQVTDNYQMAQVYLEVRNPTGGLVGNFTMSLDPGSGRYFYESSYSTLGTFWTNLSAKDTRTNWAVATGNFLIQDTTEPLVQNTVAIPSPQDAGAVLRIETEVVDNYYVFPIVRAWVEVFDPFSVLLFNSTMFYDSGQGVFFYERAYTELGFHDFIITARDGNDNYGTNSSVFEIVDITPPSVGVPTATPDPQEVFLGVNVTVAVTDNYKVQDVFIDITDPSSGWVGNFTMIYDVGTDEWGYERAYNMLGTYNCEIWAFDTSSNPDSETCSFLMRDTTAPTIENITEDPNPQNIGGIVNVSANVYDNYQLLAVRFEVWDPDSNYLGEIPMTLDPATGRYFFEAPYSVIGTYDFNVKAVDSSTIWGSVSGTFDIEDLVPPTVTAISPAPQEVHTNVKISAIANDNIAVGGAWVEVRDPFGAVLGNFSMTFNPGDGRYHYEQAYDVLGTWNFTVRAFDTNLNWASDEGSFVVQDTTGPQINAPTPPAQEIAVPITIVATVGDNFWSMSNSTLWVWINVLFPNGTAVENVTMNYDPGNDEFDYQNSFSDILGTYSFEIWAVDASGNWNSGQDSFIVRDTQDPIANAGPDQNVDQGDLVSFDGSLSTDNDPHFDGTGTYTWTFNDQGTKTLDGITPTYTFSKGGNYVVTLTVRDRSNNQGTDTVTITVTAGPNPPVHLLVTDSKEDSLKLTWSPPSQYSDGTPLSEPDIQKYTIYRSDTPDGPYEEITEVVGETEYTDTGLADNTTYYYKLTCWAGDIESEKSESNQGRTLPPAPPSEPWSLLGLDLTFWLLMTTLIIVVVVVTVLAVALLRRRKKPIPTEAYPQEVFAEAYVEEEYLPPPPPS
jgi:hypothetical protein